MGRRPIVLVLAIALLARLAVAAPEWRPLASDERDYDALARGLVEHGRYAEGGAPTAYRLPGYPAFVASVYALARAPSPRAVRIAQAILDTAAALLLYLIARRRDTRAGVAAAAIWALYPPAVLYTRLLFPETFFVFALLLVMWVDATEARARAAPGFAAGVAAGLLCLIKTEALALVAAASIERVARVRPARIAAAFVLGAALVVGAWVTRNAVMLGEPVLATSLGPVFLIGNHPRATGGYAPDVPDSLRPQAKDEVGVHRESARAALGWIREHPKEFVALAIVKVALFFGTESELALSVGRAAPAGAPSNPPARFRDRVRAVGPALPFALTLCYAALLVAGLWGYLLTPADRITAVAASVTLAWVGLHVITFGGSRYHEVLMPLAALGAVRLPEAARSGWSRLSTRRVAFGTAATVAWIAVWALEWWFLFGGVTG